jgi:hypothetical protein
MDGFCPVEPFAQAKTGDGREFEGDFRERTDLPPEYD